MRPTHRPAIRFPPVRTHNMVLHRGATPPPGWGQVQPCPRCLPAGLPPGAPQAAASVAGPFVVVSVKCGVAGWGSLGRSLAPEGRPRTERCHQFPCETCPQFNYCLCRSFDNAFKLKNQKWKEFLFSAQNIFFKFDCSPLFLTTLSGAEVGVLPTCSISGCSCLGI